MLVDDDPTTGYAEDVYPPTYLKVTTVVFFVAGLIACWTPAALGNHDPSVVITAAVVALVGYLSGFVQLAHILHVRRALVAAWAEVDAWNRSNPGITAVEYRLSLLPDAPIRTGLCRYPATVGNGIAVIWVDELPGFRSPGDVPLAWVKPVAVEITRGRQSPDDPIEPMRIRRVTR